MAIEDTMAQMAHGQVFQSLPSIANDVQGFQLIESNEDDSAAIGVLVALVSNLVVYIPVIYRKGKIYNLDILYIPELHQWLPTQDNWITYLKSRRTDLEATILPRHTKGAGKARSVDLDIPLLKIIKTASESKDVKYIERVGVPAVLKEAAADFREQLKDFEGALSRFSIPSTTDLLKKCAASDAAKRIVATITEYPEAADAMVQFYTNEELLDTAGAVVHAMKAEQTPEPKKRGEVKILTASSAEAADLTDEQKAEILRNGAVIVDTRGITPTKIYKTNKNNGGWVTPGNNGIYELLKLDGTTLTAYVIVGKRDPSIPSKGINYVIPLDGGMKRTAYEADATILGQEIPTKQFDLTGGYSLSSIPKTSPGRELLIVDIDGTAVKLMHFDPQYVGSDTGIVIRANRDAWVEYPDDSQSVWGQFPYGGNEHAEYKKRGNVDQIVVIPAGGKLRGKGRTLFVPEKCRVFEVSHNDGRYDWDSEGKQVEYVLPALARSDEFIDAISRREKLLGIKVYNDGNGFIISDDNGNVTDLMHKRAAAVDLVKRYAIDPDVANTLLSEVPPQGQERFLAKLAADANYMMSVVEKDGNEPMIDSIDLDEMSIPYKNISLTLQRAGETGLKEVMDVTVLKLLAEDGSSVRMIQDLIPSFFSAMNSVGQLLFMLRASDSMSEAYGEYRADEMEKQFAKLMQRLGDAVIVLQQGRIDDVKDLLEGPLSATLG